jgi:UDP-N-acetylmuramate: L-alanyl-gamma-D-glutamyl-meso-diaminopimelate ligase
MKIYFMGICGTAMGNAALLARSAGHDVLGADAGVYPPMSDVLSAAGIELHEGYDAERLARLAPDLVVVGNAMSRGNVEVEWLLETRALRFTSLPALLAETVLAGRRNLVICGTHGKTTTTSMAAFLLRENGRDPGFLIGGVPLDPPVGQHLGDLKDPFVIEGDEYDSAFFDKRSKFIHYAPHIAVLNNLEFDHADIFRDLADVERTFRHLTRIVPRNGFVLVNGDDANLAKLGAMEWTQVLRVGMGDHNDVQIHEFTESGDGASFTLTWKNQPWGAVTWQVPGAFNARNAAMAATATGLSLDPTDPRGLSLEPLARFRGVRRRQEIRVQREKLVVIEDFGHHPTALDQTLRSLRSRYPDHVITAVFEPRSNTARTRALEEPFQHALAIADEVYLGAVNRAERLSNAERFNRESVVAYLIGRGTDAHTAETNAQLLVKLEVGTLPGDGKPRVVVFFSNGSFDGIIDEFAKMAAG